MTAKKTKMLFAVAWLLLQASWGWAQTEVILFKLESVAGVYNNPPQKTLFRLDQPAFITKIFTYHWNDGRGATPGNIGLKNAATGQMVGRWNVTGTYHGFSATPGAAWPSRGDGPPYLYWNVQPNVNVPAGTYEVLDSDPATWAYNSEMQNMGCAWVFGSYGGGSYGQVVPSPVATPEVQPATPGNQSEVILFKLESVAGVNNNPPQRTLFRLDQPAFITKIFTYHWNDGRGATPGNIALKNAATGQMVGRWRVTGTYHGFSSTPGAAWPSRGDGPPYLYWNVQPNVNVPAGTYEVLDSDPATWAYNSEMRNMGCAWVFGSYGGGNYGQVVSSPVATPEVNPQPTYGGMGTINVTGNWSSNDGSIGSLVISQSGSDVNLKYTHSNGRVIGQLRGNVFDGYWIQDFSGRHCSHPQYNSSFWGRMVITFTGDSYAGKWGFCDDAPGSGFQGNRTSRGYGQVVPSPPATPEIQPTRPPMTASGAGHWQRGAGEITWAYRPPTDYSNGQQRVLGTTPRTGDFWHGGDTWRHRLDYISSNHFSMSDHDDRAAENDWSHYECSWSEPPNALSPGQMVQLQLQNTGQSNCYIYRYQANQNNNNQLGYLSNTGTASTTPYKVPDPHDINSDTTKAEFGFFCGPGSINTYYRYHWVGGSVGVYPPAAQQGAMSVRIVPSQQTINSGDKAVTTTDVTGGAPPYTFAWYNGTKQSQVIKERVTWTMRSAGTRDIKVVVSDSSGSTAEAHAQIEVREGGGGGSAFLQTLTSGNTLSGEAWETQGPRGGRRWPLQVRITSYDPGTGAIMGELKWPTLSSIHRIRGSLSGTSLTFTETEAIQPGSAHLNVSYTMTVSQNSADGTYTDHTDNTNGGARIIAP